mgnify:CR=1 FL=1
MEGSLDEPLFGGIAELLARLHGSGWLLGVATGKSDRGLTSCLKAHGVFDLFVTLQTADRHPSKPDPAMLTGILARHSLQPSQLAMVGDRLYTDMVMARRAGALGVLVLTGEATKEDVAACSERPNLVVPSLRELGELLAAAHGSEKDK